MPAKNDELHGNVPDKSPVALLLIDVINDLEFPGDTLLAYLKARALVLTGLAGNVCVLFTANDAFMRDFHLVVPADCVASIDPADNAHALRQMASVLEADTRPSTQIDFQDLKRRGSPVC